MNVVERSAASQETHPSSRLAEKPVEGAGSELDIKTLLAYIGVEKGASSVTLF